MYLIDTPECNQPPKAAFPDDTTPNPPPWPAHLVFGPRPPRSLSYPLWAPAPGAGPLCRAGALLTPLKLPYPTPGHPTPSNDSPGPALTPHVGLHLHEDTISVLLVLLPFQAHTLLTLLGKSHIPHQGDCPSAWTSLPLGL